MKTRAFAQQGFAAMAAIFLVVVLAALGAFMVSISNTQQLTATQDLQGSRGYWAAQAGLEWGIGSVSSTACPTSPTTLTVDSFTVVITCTAQAYTEAPLPPVASNNVNIFQFTSVAKSAGTPGGLGYIERSVSASVEK